MAIPDDDAIQRELLSLLSSSPNGRLHIREVYEVLAKQHPELTHQEKNERYENSLSKWANRVQFARLHLVQRKLMYRAGAGPSPAHGVWIITEEGRKKAEINKSPSLQSPEQIRIEGLVNQELLSMALEEELFEGKRTERLTAYFERNPKLRAAAIVHHGQSCKACGFNFKAAYGKHGDGYIEVHHLVPVSTLSEETKVNPVTEMTVLCSNCHRMVHRKHDAPLSFQQLFQLARSAQ